MVKRMMKNKILVRNHWRQGLPVRQHLRTIIKGNRGFRSKINRVLRANPGMFNDARKVSIQPGSHYKLGDARALARTDVSFNNKGQPVRAKVLIRPHMSMAETAKTIVHENAHLRLDAIDSKIPERIHEMVAQNVETRAKVPK